MKTSAFSTCAAAIASLIVMTTGLLPAEPASGAGTETNTASSWSFTPDPELPNVLIIGDSISIGYTLQVRELLQEKANLFRPMGTRGNRRENCGGTTYGVENIDRWLAVSKWDVIHFNWGLHDLKHVKEAGGNEKSNDPDDPTQATIEKYTSNMRLLVEKLKGTGARLVFATTTPVVPATLNPLRDPLAPIHYNNAALEVMKENGIRINDLHRYCLPHRNYSGQESEENTCTMNIMVLADLREAKTPDKRAAYRAGEERSRNFCGTVPQALGSRRST